MVRPAPIPGSAARPILLQSVEALQVSLLPFLGVSHDNDLSGLLNQG